MIAWDFYQNKQISFLVLIKTNLTMIVQMNTNNEEVYQILSKQQMHHSPIQYKEHDNQASISLNIMHPNSPPNLTQTQFTYLHSLARHLPGKFSTDNCILNANCNDAVNSSI
jgi:hypothetical protein